MLLLIKILRATENQYFSDLLSLTFLFAFSVLTCYFAPGIIAQIFFIIIYFLTITSKKDYLWISFLLLITFAPANFFYESETYTHLGLPQISLGIIAISAKEILLIILVIKSLVKPQNLSPLPFRKTIGLIFIYILFLIPFSTLLYGGDMVRILKDLRYVFAYLTLIPLMRLVNSIKDIERIIELVIPFSILSFIGVVYFLVSGNYLINFIAPGMIKSIELGLGLIGNRFTTVSGEHLLLLFTFVFSGFLFLKNSVMKKRPIKYIFYILISLFTIISTATRVWFIVFILILGGILFYSRKKYLSISVLLIVSFLFIIVSINIPQIRTGVFSSFSRISTLTEITKEGSYGNEDVESRLESRWPRFVKAFKINPITGLGTSTLYQSNRPGGDLGNFNLIAQGGILGFIFFLIFWIQYFTYFRKINTRIHKVNPYKNILLFFNVVLIALLVPHFTTQEIFWLVPPFADAVFLACLIVFGWNYGKQALIYNFELKNNAIMKKKGNCYTNGLVGHKSI